MEVILEVTKQSDLPLQSPGFADTDRMSNRTYIRNGPRVLKPRSRKQPFLSVAVSE